jgi:hypothetical protein
MKKIGTTIHGGILIELLESEYEKIKEFFPDHHPRGEAWDFIVSVHRKRKISDLVFQSYRTLFSSSPILQDITIDGLTELIEKMGKRKKFVDSPKTSPQAINKLHYLLVYKRDEPEK